MQDMEDDWTKEAAAMGAFYENSICTIAAAAAGDSDMERNPLTYAPCLFAGTMENGLILDPNGPYDSGLDIITANSPLFSRTWVFQEELLSLRMLFRLRDVLDMPSRLCY